MVGSARGGGVELELPVGWEKVVPARGTTVGDPQTLLVIGTDAGVQTLRPSGH